ncbi:MAG: T9SS type A sorting domain-containing protein, partial [Flavobacteriaceae bacterium]
VLSALTVTASPTKPVSICNGESVTLSSSTQNSNFTYSWTDASGNVVGTTPRLSVSSSGIYSVTVTTSLGCVTTSTNSVTVNVISVSVPSALSTSNITLTSATMNWGSVADAHHYDVRIRELGTSTWQLMQNVISTSKNRNRLTQASTYEWQVRSACSSDSSSVSSWSSIQTFNTLTPVVCVKPTNPTANNITTTSVDLNWDATNGAIGYKIKWRRQGGPVNIDTVWSTNVFRITSLTPSTNFKWRVKSICDTVSDNSSPFTSWSKFSTLSSAKISLSNDDSNISSINIFPNPSTGLININFKIENIDAVEVSINDAIGNFVQLDKIENFFGDYNKIIELNNYTKGVYFIKIKTKSSIITRRIVLQ